MATLVAPRLSPRDLSRGSRTRNRRGELRFGALLTAGLTLLALCVHGYHPYAEDGGLYVAGVKRLLDPALYPYGTEFVLEPMRFSAFAPFAAAVVRCTGAGLPWVLLLLHLGTVWATLFAAWMFAGRLFPARRAAQAGAVLLLACWLALPVAGTALLLMDPYLTARSFSTPGMIFGLVGAWDATAEAWLTPSRRRGLALCGASLVVAALMHPLMAAYGVGACLLLAALRASWPWAVAAVAVISATALALGAGMQAMARPESAEYVAIALTRSYWFLGQWRWFEWAGIVAPLIILGGFALASAKRPRPGARGILALTGAAALAGVLATVVALLFARAAGASHLVARLQPMRAMQFPYLAMILLLGAWMGERLLGSSRRRWIAAAALLSAPLYAAARGAYPASPHLELPGRAAGNAWVEAFVWVRDHTPKDALFALDPDYIQSAGEDAQCFRAIAERSVLPDRSKDGGEVAIAPELTAAWVSGQAAQHGLGAEDDAARRAALEPTGVSWVVLSASSFTSLECPYTNEAVKVCQLR